MHTDLYDRMDVIPFDKITAFFRIYKSRPDYNGMKVLLFNGSTRNNGCTYLALDQVAQTLRQAGIETELLQLGASLSEIAWLQSLRRERPVRFLRGRVVNHWIRKARQADGFVFGSPVYFAHPTGQMLAVMDRLFYAGGCL